MSDLFHAYLPESTSRLPTKSEIDEPRHRRGAIGRQALAYGVLHEADDVDPPMADQAGDAEGLCALPDPIDATWTAIADRVIALSVQAAEIGAYREANLWRRNLRKPRSIYFSLEGLERMVATMIRTAAGRNDQLGPVEPELRITELADAPAIAASISRAPVLLPAEISAAIVGQLDGLVREMAARGYPNPSAANAHNAAADVLKLKQRFQQICGATVRAINQVSHLVAVSRSGQTAHNPMTLRRRHMLVDDALAQLAEDLGTEAWHAVEAGILTDEVGRAWAAREAADPLPRPFTRNLFDWARISSLSPDAFDDAELASLIQTHPDLAYVERLRAERRRRQTLAAIGGPVGEATPSRVPRAQVGRPITMEHAR